MFRSMVSLSLLVLFGGVAKAEKYVVELECVVFDRELTDAENQQIQEKRKNNGSSYADESLRLLRQNARQLFVQKCTFVLAPSETASQKMETDAALIQAHVRLIEAKEESCKLDIQWGVGFIVEGRLGNTSSHTEERWVPIGKEQMISGSGSKGFNRCFIVHVRKAADKDLVPKLPINYLDEFRNKLPRVRRAGDLTT